MQRRGARCPILCVLAKGGIYYGPYNSRESHPLQRTQRMGHLGFRTEGRVKKPLTGLLEQCHGKVALLYHLRGDVQLLDFFVAREVVHQVQHQLFQNHA
jgi:hypothetical protein